MAWEDCEGNIQRQEVPGGWIYKVPIGTPFGNVAEVVVAVFVPEPSKVTATYDATIKHRDELGEAYATGLADGREMPSKVPAQQNEDLDWWRGHQAGYMQATANEKAKIDEIIASLENVLNLIELDETVYAVNHVNGIINALRSDKT